MELCDRNLQRYREAIDFDIVLPQAGRNLIKNEQPEERIWGRRIEGYVTVDRVSANRKATRQRCHVVGSIFTIYEERLINNK